MKLPNWLKRGPSKSVKTETKTIEKAVDNFVQEPDVSMLVHDRNIEGLMTAVRFRDTKLADTIRVQSAAAKALADIGDPRAIDILRAEIKETERVLDLMRQMADLTVIQVTPDAKCKNEANIRGLTSLKGFLAEALEKSIKTAAHLTVVTSPTQNSQTTSLPPQQGVRGSTPKEAADMIKTGEPTDNKQICCVCFEDQTGKPVMRDQMTGNLFCQQHSHCFHEMQRGLNTGRCSSCGFRYYESYGSYVKGDTTKCPKCGGRL